ncbi:long-chain-fatty-acid--CoA ligase [Thermodesulfobacteriota bacterium]
MLIGKVLAQRALITPDREALIFKDRTFTFLELNQRSNQAANALLALGVKQGDRIGLLMFNCNEFVETYFAASKIGAVLVPLNIRLAAPELDFILNDCGVSEFFYGSAFEETVGQMKYPEKVRHRICAGPSSLSHTLDYEAFIKEAGDEEPHIPLDEDDLNVVMYTSGTTGHPKGAMLTHKGMYFGGVDMLIGLHYQYPDRCLLLGPFFHSGSITPFLGHVVRGICTIIMDKFDPESAVRLIQEKKARLMVGVTVIMRMLLQVPDLETYDLDCWETAILPGSPLPYPLIKEAHDRIGVLCQNLWGLTEMCGPGSLMNIEDILDRPECAGKPYFNVDIRIVDLDGEDLPPDALGEIVVRGPNMMKGYWNRPDATAETIRDGWLFTGDMGKLDKDGYLYVIDRRKDMILSGGENIYPAEIEKVIRDMPGVADASVIGVPDEKWGEVGKVFIEMGEGERPGPEEVIAFCRSQLAGYKVPKYIEFIEELPRNPSGKVLKKNLRTLN